jgi:hypothetical protein
MSNQKTKNMFKIKLILEENEIESTFNELNEVRQVLTHLLMGNSLNHKKLQVFKLDEFGAWEQIDEDIFKKQTS